MPEVPPPAEVCTEFGSWSECRANEHGVLTQTRECLNIIQEETRVCTVVDPEKCGGWSDWSKCITGREYRVKEGCPTVYEARACNGGFGGSIIPVRKAFAHWAYVCSFLRRICPFDISGVTSPDCTWGPWGECNLAFDGKYFMSRSAEDCGLTETQACTPTDTPEDRCTSWGSWSVCRDGLQTRDCGNMSARETRTCTSEGETPPSCGE